MAIVTLRRVNVQEKIENQKKQEKTQEVEPLDPSVTGKRCGPMRGPDGSFSSISQGRFSSISQGRGTPLSSAQRIPSFVGEVLLSC